MAAFVKFRGRLVVIAELRGGICILGRRFSRAESAWMQRQGLVCGIFQVYRESRRCRAQEAAFFLKGVIFSELHSLQLFFRYHTKNDDGGAQVGNAYQWRNQEGSKGSALGLEGPAPRALTPPK